MRFYGLATCDTCRKALSELQNSGHDPVVTDVRADGVPAEELARFHAAFGDALVNRRSTTWRALSPEDRDRDAVSLLRDHPTLMKRPVIKADGRLHLGWTDAVRAALL